MYSMGRTKLCGEFSFCFGSRWRVNLVRFLCGDPHCYYAAPLTASACGRMTIGMNIRQYNYGNPVKVVNAKR